MYLQSLHKVMNIKNKNMKKNIFMIEIIEAINSHVWKAISIVRSAKVILINIYKTIPRTTSVALAKFT